MSHTTMVRIPTTTKVALQELIATRDLDESLGQLITILQRQETKATTPLIPSPIDEETIRAVQGSPNGNYKTCH